MEKLSTPDRRENAGNVGQKMMAAIECAISELRSWNPDSLAANELQEVLWDTEYPTKEALTPIVKCAVSELREWNPNSEAAQELEDAMRWYKI